jgi:hypothetical protein
MKDTASTVNPIKVVVATEKKANPGKRLKKLQLVQRPTKLDTFNLHHRLRTTPPTLRVTFVCMDARIMLANLKILKSGIGRTPDKVFTAFGEGRTWEVFLQAYTKSAPDEGVVMVGLRLCLLRGEPLGMHRSVTVRGVKSADLPLELAPIHHIYLVRNGDFTTKINENHVDINGLGSSWPINDVAHILDPSHDLLLFELQLTV